MCRNNVSVVAKNGSVKKMLNKCVLVVIGFVDGLFVNDNMLSNKIVLVMINDCFVLSLFNLVWMLIELE